VHDGIGCRRQLIFQQTAHVNEHGAELFQFLFKAFDDVLG
jgi:hypothetical protein